MKLAAAHLDAACSLVILRAMQLPELFRIHRACNLAVICLSLVFAQRLSAQQSHVTMLDFTTGSEMEDYLRVMQIAGKVPLYPWSGVRDVRPHPPHGGAARAYTSDRRYG